jgi:triosephosphate isomerase (TIM)
MYEGFDIRPPFFEVGPKAYAYGSALLELALHADSLVDEYDVRIILTPQYVDIPRIAARTSRILVFAQHMDSLEIGRGIGSVLPEAIKDAGAKGVLLGHCEKRITRDELARAIRRADAVGLATMACADDEADAEEVARLRPNIVLAEEPGLIAGARRGEAERRAIARTVERVRSVDPRIRVLNGAGIVDERDVYDVIAAGAQGTGSSSAIFKSRDWPATLEAMVREARRAWDEIRP